jgi:N-acetylglucosaminyl-diphospho-decaprenol L-rhamnosyltransferase
MVKDASGGLALRAIALQPPTTAYVAGREAQAAWRERRLPETKVVLARTRAWFGFLHLLPHALRERRKVNRISVVSRRALERRWLVGSSVRFRVCAAGGSLWSRRTP